MIVLRLGNGWKGRLTGETVEFSDPGGIVPLECGKFMFRVSHRLRPGDFDSSKGPRRSQVGTCFGISVSIAGDMNKDGFSNVIIGVPSILGKEELGDKVFIYY
jgi:hypothetical protein